MIILGEDTLMVKFRMKGTLKFYSGQKIYRSTPLLILGKRVLVNAIGLF